MRRLWLGRALPDANRLNDQEFKATLSDGQVEDALEIFYSIRKTQDGLKQNIEEL